MFLDAIVASMYEASIAISPAMMEITRNLFEDKSYAYCGYITELMTLLWRTKKVLKLVGVILSLYQEMSMTEIGFNTWI